MSGTNTDEYPYYLCSFFMWSRWASWSQLFRVTLKLNFTSIFDGHQDFQSISKHNRRPFNTLPCTPLPATSVYLSEKNTQLNQCCFQYLWEKWNYPLKVFFCNLWDLRENRGQKKPLGKKMRIWSNEKNHYINFSKL